MSQSSNPNRWSAPSPNSPWVVAWKTITNRWTWNRVLVCAIGAAILWLVTGGWAPSFPFRERVAPTRNVHARVEFKYDDPEATIRARQRARRNVLCYYQNDQRAIEELQGALIDRIFQVQSATVEEITFTVWQEFNPGDGGQLDGETLPESLNRFRAALAKDESLESLQRVIEASLQDTIKYGLLESLSHEYGEGSIQEILVYPLNNPEDTRRVDVSAVRIPKVKESLQQKLLEELAKETEKITDTDLVAKHTFAWLEPRLIATLALDKAATDRAIRLAEDAIEPVKKQFLAGDPLERPDLIERKIKVIEAGEPLTREDIMLLRAEHSAFVKNMNVRDYLTYSAAHAGMFAGVFLLLTGYLVYREKHLINDLGHFTALIALLCLTVVTAWVLSVDVSWRSELIPFTMFAMAIAIACNRELAILLGGIAALIFSVGHGYGITEFVILMSATAAAGLLCGRIRSRTRLVYVGLLAAAVTFPTAIGINLMNGQPFSMKLLLDAAWFSSGVILAGLLMTALLPFLEKWFGVETDISLLELSDANHPLLRQLVQRAPGTYNHSINVASIAEAAADSIGANGLLCRVAAYFHDIGKMRKPEYFIENQFAEDNKHDQLVPTMSTLVIIAHVKDGAEMARKHQLPDRIVDMIEQHHGTTLVEYFYHQERVERGEQDEDEVQESSFRYPGPKPQTPEAAVMMLADSVESATRTLREPTPSRIENLVAGVLKKKLEDGQFDECAVTLKQLNTISDQLIKSLNAMYHARVKYPGQQPA